MGAPGERKLSMKWVWVSIGIAVVVVLAVGLYSIYAALSSEDEIKAEFVVIDWNTSTTAQGDVMFSVTVKNRDAISSQGVITCKIQTLAGSLGHSTLTIDLGPLEVKSYQVLVDVPAQDDSQVVYEECTVTAI